MNLYDLPDVILPSSYGRRRKRPNLIDQISTKYRFPSSELTSLSFDDLSYLSRWLADNPNWDANLTDEYHRSAAAQQIKKDLRTSRLTTLPHRDSQERIRLEERIRVLEELLAESKIKLAQL